MSNDRKQLQGKWSITSLETNGRGFHEKALSCQVPR